MTTASTPTAATDAHGHWVDRAREVAAVLARDALERDRANAEPFAEAGLLREAGLPALLIPAEHGGAGQTWRTALAVVREVSRADGSIGQLIGYHYVNLVNLWWTGSADARAELLARSAREQWLWGDAVNPIDPDLALAPHGDGYRLSGRKAFSTGASVGDAIVATGAVSTTGEPLLVAVLRGQAGIELGGDWDNLGQRLSASGSVAFHDVDVPADRVLASLAPEAVTPRASLITPAIQAVFGHLYLGVAEGALAAARDYTRERARPWVLGTAPAATQEPHVLEGYGGLVARVAAVAALADRVAAGLAEADARGAALTWRERGDLAVDVAQLKVVSTEVSLDVTSRIFEFTGARSTASSYGLDRFWRNVRTHTLHDPVAYKRREVGERYLNGRLPEFTLYT
ncbi:MAG: acyl-CoA dehydrogenase family protein [Thermoleophilia bacterium]